MGWRALPHGYQIMSLEYDTLLHLRQSHPAWRLLCAANAPLIASFLERVFVLPNVRVISQGELAEALEDELFARRQTEGEKAYTKRAQDYLNHWSAPEQGWIRRFYADDSDEPSYDLTPATEKTIAWLQSLLGRQFVATESRLLTLFELLKQISEGTDKDPESRRSELLKRRAEIDAQIAQIDDGHLPMLDDTSIRDRFQQFTSLARELLSDFREVEENFRQLDRESRERIARWEGSKGELLAEILDERDTITGTDQGRSFQAFFDFLMSPQRQEELGDLLNRVLSLAALEPLSPDRRLRKVHHDWHIAAEHAQGTVRALSRQLRQFLDDQAWIENRRIMDIIRQLENHALDIRANPPRGPLTSIEAMAPRVELPMERPLFVPVQKQVLDSTLCEGHTEADAMALYDQVVIDRDALIRHAHSQLQQREQISLAQLIEGKPLTEGLAELVAWLQLADTEFKSVTNEAVTDTIVWKALADDGTLVERSAKLPAITLLRP